jgi:hypothetical protein
MNLLAEKEVVGCSGSGFSSVPDDAIECLELSSISDSSSRSSSYVSSKKIYLITMSLFKNV